MKSITENVLIEDSFAGVVVGALRFEQGIIFIDSPLMPRDAQTWRNSLIKSGGGTDRQLVLLDEHPDRCMGAKSLKCNLIAHERTALALAGRPISAKPVLARTGSIWETLTDLGNLHTSLPEITFTNSMQVHWGQEEIILEYHPGPARGAIWVLLPSMKIVFVGDCVLSQQPPFLASADLSAWLDSLATLRSAKYRDYILISSRSGIVNQEDVKQQSTFIKHIQSQMEKLAQNKAEPFSIEGLIPEMVKEFNPRNQKEEEFFKARLSWGLQQLYSNHYYPSAKSSNR